MWGPRVVLLKSKRAVELPSPISVTRGRQLLVDCLVCLGIGMGGKHLTTHHLLPAQGQGEAWAGGGAERSGPHSPREASSLHPAGAAAGAALRGTRIPSSSAGWAGQVRAGEPPKCPVTQAPRPGKDPPFLLHPSSEQHGRPARACAAVCARG